MSARHPVGQARQDDHGVARWVIQGNGWATWVREL